MVSQSATFDRHPERIINTKETGSFGELKAASLFFRDRTRFLTVECVPN
ncbi:MAG: hypothetical protein HC849_27925 [Oscillatoriales cyanobacterium RU_3_3]|nr:hypothetical protein [Microcoleus sp. SU_5_6]NJL69019.1 hypothetical protein [Microcoleus sp. SM1_3_4]NJM63142.1 hypothetical protein [Oscillatoriales cyanobacterium RU_3_3]NJR21818.1 hypothetical protein [Richelia sp. CSU_2_1]